MSDAVIYNKSPNSQIGSKPSAPQVLHLASKSGYLEKKNNSFWAYFFPWFFPKYKSRFFILAGGFLYKFESEYGESPKGIPLPLSSCEVHINEDDEDHCSFEINTVRKKYIIRALSEEECQAWMHAINRRKLESIKESMGHKEVSREEKILNNAANAIYEGKIEAESKSTDIINPIYA